MPWRRPRPGFDAGSHWTRRSSRSPGAQDDPDPRVRMPELRDVGEVAGNRRRHEHERHRAGPEDDREHALAAQQLQAVAGARLRGAGRVDDAPADRQCEQDGRDHQERRRVGEEGDAGPGARRQRSADQRTDHEPDRARGLDEPVRAADLPRAGEQRDEGELRRLRHRHTGAEHECQREDRGQRIGEGEGTDDHRLEDRRPDRERTGLHTVDEHADVPGEHGERGPQADQQHRHPGAVPQLVRAQRERDHRHPVADRRDRDRRGDDPRVGSALRRSPAESTPNRRFGQNPPYTNTRSRRCDRPLDGGRRACSPRRPGAQPEGHHGPAPAERAHLHHRPFGLGEVEPCLRHDLRRGSAPVRRIALRVRPPVPADEWRSRTWTRSTG